MVTSARIPTAICAAFTPDTPPVHGNWGAQLPVVYRWAYAYSVPGAPEDYIAQNAPPEAGGQEPEPVRPKEAIA